VINERIGLCGEEPIYRYHLCSGWRHCYRKCRPEIAVCIAATLKRRIFMRGHWLKDSLADTARGLLLPNELDGLKFDKKKFLSYGNTAWHPDFWVFNPDDFVDGIEEGDWGKEDALNWWLKYEADGLLATGYSRGSNSEGFLGLKELIAQ